MSSEANSRARRLALAGALFVVISAWNEASAFELRFWPLLEWSHEGSESVARALGPVVEWRRGPSTRSFALRPLFYSETDSAGENSHGSLLYPLATWSRSADELSVHFLGLGSYVSRSAPPADRPYRRELTVFPLLFYRQGEATGTSFSLLPIYGDIADVFGYKRVRLVLFPLYLRVEEPLWRRTWLPFPFFSRVGGPAGEGTRLWPVYGRTVLGREYTSSYILWPFYVRATAHPAGAEPTTTRVSWPLFSAIDGPRLHSRSYAFLLVLPLYTDTVDVAHGTETTGFPWPFWVRQVDRRSGEQTSLRLTPFYERRRTAAAESVFYLWPFYRRHEGLGDDAGYRRTDVLFLFYRDQWESEAEHRSHIRAVVPAWVGYEDEHTARGQSLTLLDGLFPKNDALRVVYAPLYRIYGMERQDGVEHHDVFWRLVTWGDGKIRPPWYFSSQ